MALCLRFDNNIRHKWDGKPLLTGAPTVQEPNQATSVILRMIQWESFAKEIEQLVAEMAIKDILLNLRQFVDSDGLMWVGGRLTLFDLPYGQRYPIILSRGHHVTQLILRDTDLVGYHAGVLATLSLVRERYWPIDAKCAIRAIIHGYVVCRRASPTILKHLMGDLPPHRITSNRPFLIAGVDYCGPIL